MKVTVMAVYGANKNWSYRIADGVLNFYFNISVFRLVGWAGMTLKMLARRGFCDKFGPNESILTAGTESPITSHAIALLFLSFRI